MKWLWIILGVIALGGAGYYIYGPGSKPTVAVKPKLHEGKALLYSKTRQHNALWIHYTYKDKAGKTRDMSERVPYIDLWESLEEGKEIEILYDDEGRSVLKIKAQVGRQQQSPQ